MDRDELQDRIRARRSGGEPYRRGGMADDEAAYQRFEPTPEDARVRQERRPAERRPDHFDEAAAAAAAAAAAGPSVHADEPSWPDEARIGHPDEPTAPVDRPDLTRDQDEWSTPVAASAPAPVPPVESAPWARPSAPRAEDPFPDEPVVAADGYEDPVDDGEPYEYDYDTWEEPQRRSGGGAGAFAILGFLALGVLALIGGAVLAGVFGGDGVAEATATPSAAVSVTPTASPPASVAPSGGSGDPQASASAAASGEPVVFPDGFTALAQPCIPGSVRADGCDENGAVNSGQVEIWVGFTNGTPSDVIGAQLIGPDGNALGDGAIDLADIGCAAPCRGYTFFNFSNLVAGTYEVRISRNGDFASSTSFEVS
jgi:hypothetical protein